MKWLMEIMLVTQDWDPCAHPHQHFWQQWKVFVTFSNVDGITQSRFEVCWAGLSRLYRGNKRQWTGETVAAKEGVQCHLGIDPRIMGGTDGGSLIKMLIKDGKTGGKAKTKQQGWEGETGPFAHELPGVLITLISLSFPSTTKGPKNIVERAESGTKVLLYYFVKNRICKKANIK